jgi:hypothetical protein
MHLLKIRIACIAIFRLRKTVPQNGIFPSTFVTSSHPLQYVRIFFSITSAKTDSSAEAPASRFSLCRHVAFLDGRFVAELVLHMGRHFRMTPSPRKFS